MNTRTKTARVDAAHTKRNSASLMARILNRMNIALSDALRAHRITNQHFRILQLLYDDDNITIGELSRRLVVRQPVISRILIQMEERGLIIRSPDENDSRFRNILLTKAGHDLYELVWPDAKTILDETAASLTKQEHEEFLRILAKVDADVNPEIP